MIPPTITLGDGITRIVLNCDSQSHYAVLYMGEGNQMIQVATEHCPGCGALGLICPVTDRPIHIDGSPSCHGMCENCRSLADQGSTCLHCTLDDRKAALECEECNRLYGNLTFCPKHDSRSAYLAWLGSQSEELA